MLIYHPAYDAYHCIFRLLTLMEGIKSVEVAKIRILDFFLIFPAEVSKIRLSPAQIGTKKLARSLANVYHGPISTTQVFRDMEHIQIAAINALAASNIINVERLSQGFVERTSASIPDAINQIVIAKDISVNPLINFIITELSSIPLLGIDGLKHRTGLMEYRYDNV